MSLAGCILLSGLIAIVTIANVKWGRVHVWGRFNLSHTQHFIVVHQSSPPIVYIYSPLLGDINKQLISEHRQIDDLAWLLYTKEFGECEQKPHIIVSAHADRLYTKYTRLVT